MREEQLIALAQIGHAASNEWLRKNRHPPYPEWEALTEVDRILRCETAERILKGEEEKGSEEEEAFNVAVRKKAKEWKLL